MASSIVGIIQQTLILEKEDEELVKQELRNYTKILSW